MKKKTITMTTAERYRYLSNSQKKKVPFWLPPHRWRRRWRRQLGFTTAAAAMNSETANLKKKPLDDAKKKFKRLPLYSSMKKQLDDDSSSEDERTE